jgi:hypothetical protein
MRHPRRARHVRHLAVGRTRRGTQARRMLAAEDRVFYREFGIGF